MGTVLRPGQVVGEKYRVERLLAEGGMAAVWAGTNTRTGKQVALKVMLPVFAAVSEAMELFRREALAASRVNHPNVVNIFDVIDHDGMTCIVMELLDGETLAAYLATRGALPLEEAVELLLPAMRGVAAANARGIIHRDLKPGNLFLCKDPEGRLITTKVLDFGISMSAERSVDYTSESPVRFGTPAYMAPEDIEYPQVIDSRTDVYGFGVLLFETLTGKLPFPGEPSQALLTRILKDPPPKIAVFRADLPAEVQLVLDRALAKNPSDRFPDVGHLVRAIEDQLSPELPGQRSLSRTPALGTSQVDESQAYPLVTVTSSGAGSGPTRLPTRTWKPDFSALRERRTLGAALLLGTLLVTPWLAFHGRDARQKEPSQPTHPSPAPIVTPLPAALPVAPPAALAGTTSDLPTVNAGHGSVGVLERIPPRPQPDIKGNASVASRTAVRSPRPARAPAELRRARPLAHTRAGPLSASDF